MRNWKFWNTQKLVAYIRSPVAFQFLNGVFCVSRELRACLEVLSERVTILIASRQFGVTPSLHCYLGKTGTFTSVHKFSSILMQNNLKRLKVIYAHVGKIQSMRYISFNKIFNFSNNFVDFQIFST